MRKDILEKINNIINEGISKEERAKIVEYSKHLKKVLTKEIGKVKIEVSKTKKPNPFIRVIGDIPNEFRVKVVKALDIKGVLDMDNVDYGNIRSNYIALNYSEWLKVMGDL